MTFESAMVLTRTVGSHTSFEDPECHAYFDLLMTLPPDSLIVEVGLEYGRSSSIALQVAGYRNLKYWGIDIDVKDEWLQASYRLNPRPWMYVAKTKSSNTTPDCDISAILIDGDHSHNGVIADCEHFLPHVVVGGYAMFHDYGRDSLPEVYQAVNDYLTPRLEWSHVGVYGTLGIWRRIL
jgi:cephalosporin hydroxylase